MTAPMVRSYFNSSASTVTIPAKSSQFVLYADVANKLLVNGKLSMTSNKGNVYARIVYGNTSTAASTYFSITNQEPANGTQFCGQLNYAQKNVTVNANSTSAFVLGEWPAPVNGTRPFKNTNEYNTVLSKKSGSANLLGANYGIPYRVTVTNASGKRLKITQRLRTSLCRMQLVLGTRLATRPPVPGITRLATRILPPSALLFRVQTTVISIAKS